MKLRLLDYLRCPVSGAPLKCKYFEIEAISLTAEHLEQCDFLEIERSSVERVVKEGVLYCESSGIWYPISEYVPILLDFETAFHSQFKQKHLDKWDEFGKYRCPDNAPRAGEEFTQKTFTTEWNDLIHDELSFTYTEEERRKYMELELDWPSDIVPNIKSRTLDVGCGYSREAYILQKVTAGEVFAIELNFSVLSGFKKYAHHPFLHVVMASAFSIPFEERSFDLVYSNGVLHHTYSTKKAFKSICRYRKPGGAISIWIYADEDMDYSLRSRIVHIIEVIVRPRLAKMPRWAQNVVIYPIAWNHYTTTKREGVYGVKDWANKNRWKFRNSVHFVRDCWTPVYAHRESFNRVIEWMTGQGLDYSLVDPAKYRALFGYNVMGIGIRGSEYSRVASEQTVRSSNEEQKLVCKT